MLLGLNAGLLLLGVRAPLNLGEAATSHGVIMTLGFVGALVSLERAVANGAWWAFAAPVLLALGAIAGVVPVVLDPAPRILIMIGTVLALGMYWPLWRRNYDPSVAVQALGAALAVGAGMQWLAGSSAAVITPWLTSYLILTIAGERMELSRLIIRMKGVKARDTEALAVCIALALAVCFAGIAPWGTALFGLALLVVAVRFAIRDVARYTVKSTGLPRFSAACMLAGYAWLAVAGLLWGHFAFMGGSYDAAVHAITLGFVMSMILAHASIILPAVLRRPLPYTPWFWLVFALFQVGLAVRIVGNVGALPQAYRIGGIVTVVAMLAFFATAIASTVIAGIRTNRTAHAKAGAAGAAGPASGTPGTSAAGSSSVASTRDAAAESRRTLSGIAATAGIIALVSGTALALGGVADGTGRYVGAESIVTAGQGAQSAEAGKGGDGEQNAVSSTNVQPTGHTTNVDVSMAHMAFSPQQVTVPAGDSVTITVTNDDSEGHLHDLVIATDQGEKSTKRLAPGESETLDIGVVTHDLDGWCSVAGHKQAGMTFAIKAVGGNEQAGSGDAHAHHGANPGTGGDEDLTPSAWKNNDLPAGFKAHNATAPTAPTPGEAQTHEYTMTVSELQSQVAPGITQEVWTFNGTAPGPVLRGKVGDKFVITFVNDGTIGHGIDFHSSALAPDKPMRTIKPGERLTYTFTAKTAGYFTYHCSAKPMSTHIANGMAGTVIIDPAEGLPSVDHEFALAQTEQYHGPQGEPGNAAKITAEKPDAVVFNGYPHQYVTQPLEVKTGERVRIWVAAIGPQRDLDFHIVGGAFDTVWSEGAYTVVCGHEPWSPEGQAATKGGADGCRNPGELGSQTMHVGVTQGGFVELTFHEAGHYSFINHQMVNAENGARGVIHVTD